MPTDRASGNRVGENLLRAEQHRLSAVSRLMRAISLLLLFSATTSARTAEPFIELTTRTAEVYQGDTILLEITSTGLLDPMDLSVLQQDARFIRETTGTLIEVHDGQVVEIGLRRMEFTPTRTGIIVFGPVTAGEIVSNPVSVSVLEHRKVDWQPEPQDLQIHVTVSPEQAVLHQQSVLDIELWHRYPIASESVSGVDPPAIPNRTVYRERRTTRTDIDGHTWHLVAWRYLLYPDSPQSIPTGTVNWTGIAIRSRLERAAFERNHAGIDIRVQAPTADMPWWLPATDLEISESWSSPPTGLKAGDELIRSITLTARNVTAAHLPEPQVPESRALRQHLVGVERREQLDSHGITATARFDYRLRAISPIPVFLDTVRVPWWNTLEQEATQAIIPARRINVGIPDRDQLKARLADDGISASWHLVWRQTMADLPLFRWAVYAVTLILVLMTAVLYLHDNRLRRCHLWFRKRRFRQLSDSAHWAVLFAELEQLFLSPHYRRPVLPLTPLTRQLYGSRAARDSADHHALQKHMNNYIAGITVENDSRR